MAKFLSQPIKSRKCNHHNTNYSKTLSTWWRHQMKTFSALLAICAGNSPVTGEFPGQRPVTRSFDVFFDLHMNKWLNKPSRRWWFETPSCPLWRHSNVYFMECTISAWIAFQIFLTPISNTNSVTLYQHLKPLITQYAIAMVTISWTCGRSERLQ